VYRIANYIGMGGCGAASFGSMIGYSHGASLGGRCGVVCGSEIFWTALSERRGGLELSRGRSQRRDSFGHEPALVARCRSPAKLLLGFPKFVGIPRCVDHRRCHPCCWHSQGGPAAMAPSRTSEQLRRVGIATTRRQNGQALISRAVGLDGTD